MQAALTTLRRLKLKVNAPNAAASNPATFVTRLVFQGGHNVDGVDEDNHEGALVSLPTSLRELRLAGYQPGFARAAMFAHAIGRLTALSVLDLRNTTIVDSAIQELLPNLGRLARLTALKLSASWGYLIDDRVQDLAQALSGLTALKSIDLHRIMLQDGGTRALAQAFARMEHLTALSLGNNWVAGDGIQHLSSALGCMSALRELSLFETLPIVGVDGARTLATALVHLSSLTGLDLGYGLIGIDGARALALTLGSLHHLRILNLERNYISFGVEALVPALTRLSALMKLNLRVNHIPADCALALASALAHLTALTALLLGDNALGHRVGLELESGICALAPSVAHLKALEVLDLSENRMSDLGTLKLALTGLSALSMLNLEANGLGVDDVRELSPVVPLLPKLAQLRLGVSGTLNFSGVGADAVKQLQPILRFLDGVTCLDFSNNDLNTEEAQALIASMKSLPSLLRLNLRRNNICLHRGEKHCLQKQLANKSARILW